MDNKLILIIIYFSSIFPQIDSKYIWPTKASNTVTEVFGAERSRRFHAGIDVRTYGKIGKELYAVESGYISRIKISPDGYGKSVYLKLDDGNTILYAHLDKFHKHIEEKSNNLKKVNTTHRSKSRRSTSPSLAEKNQIQKPDK